MNPSLLCTDLNKIVILTMRKNESAYSNKKTLKKVRVLFMINEQTLIRLLNYNEFLQFLLHQLMLVL
jgi:hypothetical protein